MQCVAAARSRKREVNTLGESRVGKGTNAELARLANAACTAKHLGNPRRLGTGQASRVAQDIDLSKNAYNLSIPKGKDSTNVDTLGNTGVSNEGHISISMDLINYERTLSLIAKFSGSIFSHKDLLARLIVVLTTLGICATKTFVRCLFTIA